MQQADFQRFKSVMAGMAKLYERDIDVVLLDAYWLSLHNWSLEEFEQAAGHLMANSKFMPRPAEFTELRKAGRPTAGEAWASVQQYIKDGWVRWDGGDVSPFGTARPPVDPLIAKVVHILGGYRVIAMCELDKLCFLERRFAEHYESIQDAQDTREALPALTATKQLNGPKSITDLLPSVETP